METIQLCSLAWSRILDLPVCFLSAWTCGYHHAQVLCVQFYLLFTILLAYFRPIDCLLTIYLSVDFTLV